jgi:hypothetical protein
VHPSLASLQTLHGLVNKESPANLALAIEVMGWLGGAPARGQVAAAFIQVFQAIPMPKEGATGLLDTLSNVIAQHVWSGLPALTGRSQDPAWPSWPRVRPVAPGSSLTASLAACTKTPFAWFWRKWARLTDPSTGWYEVLPARRFVDWAMCLLRTGLAFSYLWEAELYTRLHERISERLRGTAPTGGIDRVRSMLTDGVVLAAFEPPRIPASQKATWEATAELLARGYVAREEFLSVIGDNTAAPPGGTVADILDAWVQALAPKDLEELGRALHVPRRTANNQKEFVKYLVLPRASNDDLLDQADFYNVARTNGRSTWFQPGPEWLVVITSLLCERPGGECTLGDLVEDLASLGVRVDRSVLVGLLEESGLSTDSPDADNALVIKSGF